MNTAQITKTGPTQNRPEPQGFEGAPPWAMDAPEVEDNLGSDADQGLDRQEADARLKKYGHNRIRAKKSRTAWQVLVAQLKNLIVLLLVVAAGVSFVLGQILEGISIMVAMIINVVIGFGTELRAVRSMEALQEMTRVQTKVLRKGRIQVIPAANLVPGDIVVLEGGDMVPADLRLVEANRMEADESALTGESIPVAKQLDPVAEDSPLAERSCMLFKGTALTQGSGKGVVVATGMSTELGHISELAERAEEEELTPLEQRLNRLGQRLIWLTLAVAGLVGLTGFFTGQNFFLIFETSIALAVAAIPEGLPIVATIALARGMWRMAQKNALVNRLSSVETLGATSVICTDKTGTLTENKMTVTTLGLPAKDGVRYVEVDQDSDQVVSSNDGETLSDPIMDQFRKVVTMGVLCNNAQLSGEDKGVGDPLEVALLQVGRRFNISREALLEAYPETEEVPFSADTKMMATWHRHSDSSYLASVKGAPENVIAASTKIMTADSGEQDLDDAGREELVQANKDMAAKGLRMLAVARRESGSPEDNPYESLTFLGLVGLLDPPRKGVKEVIEDLGRAGIKVVMITGDQPITAKYIGNKLGLGDGQGQVIHGRDLKGPDDLSQQERKELLRSSIFARISPEQKLDIISLYQADGSVVAMTGDGVNDAPALTKADIGVAMGKRGTQVAREASDIVLKDDAFSTIALAVEQGRIIFNNIRKFIVFLLSGNVGAILIVGLAMLFGTTLPLLPLQILYLNMISDVFPALALGVGKGEHAVMNLPPRPPHEAVVPRTLWVVIIIYGVLIAATVLASFWIALHAWELETDRAVTISFLTLAFTRTWHVFNMRDFGSNPVLNDVTRNPFVWGAVFLSVGLLLLAVYLTPLAAILSMIPPRIHEWGLILGMSLAPLILVQSLKQFTGLDPVGRKK